MNRNRQRGMTLMGWVIVLAVFGVFAIAVLRAGPLYMEYYKIHSVLTSLPKEMGSGTTKQDIYSYLSKRFNIEAITVIKAKEVKIERKGENYEVRANYDARSPFIGNLNFIITFDKSVEVPR